ncbi:D-amino-acid transaminase [Acidisphaera sp. L21]|uniref:D-amino-acid transaminase n=1 Tax=Acidisphaera sp. L21 TaxID=1641851 RepID=UPI00131BA1C4|nr:D-amino-acid transaminase [Acidisphaera sp. L21]
MSRIAYVNGQYLPQSEASVNVEDRGYQLADGVYEVLYMKDGRFLDEDLHMKRLERSLGEIRITPPMGRAAMLRVIREVTERNRLRDGLIYMQVTRGVARRDHAFPARPVPAAMVITCRRTPPYPKSAEAFAGSAISVPDLRWARCDIKSTALLPNVLAKQAAREAGAYEAILIDRDGAVSEGSSTTVWVVDANGVLRTRELSHAILPGCTRASLLEQMADAGIASEERAVTEAELRSAQEVFLTSATSFVKPITKIDGAPVGDGKVGPITRRLFELFAQHAKGGSNIRA